MLPRLRADHAASLCRGTMYACIDVTATPLRQQCTGNATAFTFVLAAALKHQTRSLIALSLCQPHQDCDMSLFRTHNGSRRIRYYFTACPDATGPFSNQFSAKRSGSAHQQTQNKNHLISASC